MDDKTYGPYTGHQLKDFANEGRIDGNTSVIREGSEEWARAADDSRLLSLFSRPLIAPPPPPSNISAEKGATVVQVNNHLSPSVPLAALIEDGPYGPKSPGLALVLSLLICGGGQMYNGQIGKGILMLIGCILLWFVLLGWIISIWSIVDAYQTAKKMNLRFQRRLAAGLPI